MPSVESARVHGVSNLNTFRDGFRVLRTIVRERALHRDGALPTVSVAPSPSTAHRSVPLAAATGQDLAESIAS